MGATGSAIAGDVAQVLSRKQSPPAATPKAAMVATSKKATCRADVVEACRRDELRPLWLGRYCFEWIAAQTDRGQELKAIKMDLVAAQLVGHAARLDYFICVYWVATALGWDDAQQLRVSAIRGLRRLFGRNSATGEWQVRPSLEAAARSLWRRMIRDRLPAHAVEAEVRRLRPARAGLKIDRAARDWSKLVKEIKRLPADRERLEQLARLIQDRLANAGRDAA